MKKLLSILLALLMVFALVGCTPKQEETPAEGGETPEVAEEGKVLIKKEYIDENGDRHIIIGNDNSKNEEIVNDDDVI